MSKKNFVFLVSISLIILGFLTVNLSFADPTWSSSDLESGTVSCNATVAGTNVQTDTTYSNIDLGFDPATVVITEVRCKVNFTTVNDSIYNYTEDSGYGEPWLSCEWNDQFMGREVSISTTGEKTIATTDQAVLNTTTQTGNTLKTHIYCGDSEDLCWTQGDTLIYNNVYVEIDYTNPPTITSVSDSPDPVTAKSDITFTVNWTDPDSGDQTKIHICKTNAISGQTCSEGSWCDTIAWSSTSPTSCSYTTKFADVETSPNPYYAFVCDDDNVCSSSISGSFTVGELTVPSPPVSMGKANVSGDAWSENIGWINFLNRVKPEGGGEGIVHLKFDEGTGNKTYDETDYQNHGYFGPAPYDPAWKTADCSSDDTNCLEFDGDDHIRVDDSESLDAITDGVTIDAWIKGSGSGFSESPRSTGAGTRDYVQFQVVGDKVYYVWRERDASDYYQIWTAESNIDGTGWTETLRKTTNKASYYSPSTMPDFQVVGDKIYYAWTEYDPAESISKHKFFTAESNIDGLGWSDVERRKDQWEMFGPQLQVVGNKIYYAWTGHDGGAHRIFTGSMNTDGTDWQATMRTTHFSVFSPQLQVVGDKIYYVYEGPHFFKNPQGYSIRQIFTAESNIDGSGWSAAVRSDWQSDLRHYSPQLQVVGGKIYYVYTRDTSTADQTQQIITARMNIDGTGWTETQRTSTTTNSKWNPQLQVVGDKIYYVWYEVGVEIREAEMNTNGTGWNDAQLTTPGSSYIQFQVVGAKTYYAWTRGRDIYTAKKNSNLIYKGDFFGIGVRDDPVGGPTVIGFVNAGVDGFKYKGEAIDYTAGAVVSSSDFDPANWTHVIVAYNYDEGLLKLYLNGAEKDSFAFSENINVNPFDLLIGDDFVGAVDEVKIYRHIYYGVHICENDADSLCADIAVPKAGQFIGYAWSENIGWINFDPVGPYPEAPNHSVKVDLTPTGIVCGAYGNVCGWARACAGADLENCSGGTNPDAGGWNGWIKLRGDTTDGNTYGVWIETGVRPKEFQDWAWGSDVVGWISFNCENCEGTACDSYPSCGDPGHPDYKVITTLSFPPNVSDPDETFDCCAYEASPQVAPGVSVTLNWTYFDPDNDPQIAYKIWLDDSEAGLDLDPSVDPKFNHVVDHTPLPGPDFGYTLDLNNDDDVEGGTDWLSELAWGTRYYWKVKVKDETGKWSGWSEVDSFDMPPHGWPDVDFGWILKPPTAGEAVEFIQNDSDIAQSLCYAYGTEDLCENDPSNYYIYEWDFSYDSSEGFIVDSNNKGNTTWFYDIPGEYRVRLRITDNSLTPPGSCTKEKLITVILPLPEWKEISPF